jgi:FtsP/CotA-like multicopper oxidase with cupredoxin domain
MQDHATEHGQDHEAMNVPEKGGTHSAAAPASVDGSPRDMEQATADGTDGMPMDHEQMSMAPEVTGTQIAAVAFGTVLALAAGIAFSAFYTNLGLGAHDVGGAIMPPGMIMTYDTPGQSMLDMAAVDPRDVAYTAPPDARGDQLLQPRMENGVKVYDLETSVIKWNILPHEQVMAYAYNRQVPGPRIRLTQGDRVRINVTNNLPEATTVHWHGLIVPNNMDGPAEVTQDPIEPGQVFTYEFTVGQAGTFMYHTHREPDRQQALGLYGALIIDPQAPTTSQTPATRQTPQGTPGWDLEYTVQLQEWLEREGYTYPAMLMEGTLPNFFTINGKAYPSTDTINMRVGQRVLLRFIGTNNNFVHPMHVHGGPFRIVATDGNPVRESAQVDKDTVNVGPGERYDVVWTARQPGKWLVHCHIPHHTTNDNVEEQGAGGLTMVINVTP